jgi:hypothetical protein
MEGDDDGGGEDGDGDNDNGGEEAKIEKNVAYYRPPAG